MTERIKKILIRRDGMEEHDAEELIQKAKEELSELFANPDGCTLQDAEALIMDYFSLEPDYLDDILPI